MRYLSRRQFLKRTTFALLSVWVYRLFADVPPEEIMQQTYPAFLDTIIPRDQTPSATDLEIDQMIVQEIRPQMGQWSLCLLACISLHKAAYEQYQQGFEQLTEVQRVTLLHAWLADKDKTNTQIFFQFHRQRAMEYYYAQAASWPGLGIDRPPQPLGYMDYQCAPGQVESQ